VELEAGSDAPVASIHMPRVEEEETVVVDEAAVAAAVAPAAAGAPAAPGAAPAVAAPGAAPGAAPAAKDDKGARKGDGKK
jgi:hypothetical protein